MRSITKLRAAMGLAVAQLRHYRVRTALAVLAIALAVLSTTLLASVGVGVMQTGVEKFQQSEQDLWVTGGPLRFAPGSLGGFENAIVDSHEIAHEIGTRQDVAVAAPIAYQTVYVGTDPDDLRTLVGVGVPNVGNWLLQLDAGSGFEQGGDVHYANGSYEGPMTREVIIDPRTAELFDVGVGDTLYVGGTVANARRNEFTVVGISPTFSRFLGTPTAALHLSELQTLTGTAGTDRASVITVRLEPGADPGQVEAELERAYPEYEVRTNREQLESLLREQALVIASGVVLVVLAVLTGLALSANVLALIVYHQRETLGALKAGGVSSGTLVGMIIAQAVLLGALGGAVGVAATPPLVRGANLLAERVVGFSDLARTPDLVLAGGFAIALVIGTLGAVVAGWRIVRISPLEHLQR